MAKNAVSDWSTTASFNTDLASINIDEGCPAANINNAIRELMAQVRTLNPVSKNGDADVGTVRFGGASTFSTVTNGGTIELCSTFPYIDIKNNAADDFDVRLGLNGTTNALAVSAAGGIEINGSLAWHDGRASSGTGWDKLPNGLIIQTGSPVVTVSAFGTGIVTLPTPFASGSSYIVVLSNADAAVNLQFQLLPSGGYPSATQFAFQAVKPDGSYQNGGNVRIAFHAIGK